MGGMSGSSVASHTLLARRGGYVFRVSAAQRRIIQRALIGGGTTMVTGRERRSAMAIPSTLGEVTEFGTLFAVKEGVSL